MSEGSVGDAPQAETMELIRSTQINELKGLSLRGGQMSMEKGRKKEGKQNWGGKICAIRVEQMKWQS